MPISRANGPLIYITLKQFVDYQQQKKAEQQRQAQALAYPPPSFPSYALNGDQFYKEPNRSPVASLVAFSGATPSKMQEDAKQRRNKIRQHPKATPRDISEAEQYYQKAKEIAKKNKKRGQDWEFHTTSATGAAGVVAGIGHHSVASPVLGISSAYIGRTVGDVASRELWGDFLPAADSENAATYLAADILTGKKNLDAHLFDDKGDRHAVRELNAQERRRVQDLIRRHKNGEHEVFAEMLTFMEQT